MKRQHEAGKILLSGPGKTEAGQVGIYLIRADSRDEAERIAGSDPFTAAGSCNFELIEWNVHQIMGVGPFSQAELEAPHQTDISAEVSWQAPLGVKDREWLRVT